MFIGCHFSENFGSVLKDGSRAILTNPKSSKAHYRSALALIQLERYDEAIDCCDRCLCFDKDNKDVRTLRERARQEKTIKDKKERERQDRLRREGGEQEAARESLQGEPFLFENWYNKKPETALKDRNLVVIPRPDGSSENAYAPSFDPEDTTGSTLNRARLLLVSSVCDLGRHLSIRRGYRFLSAPGRHVPTRSPTSRVGQEP